MPTIMAKFLIVIIILFAISLFTNFGLLAYLFG